MPRKRATRVKTHAKPKKPENDIGIDLDAEERKHKLEVFLKDFDMEVSQRLERIESDKIRLKSLIEKELNLQLRIIPKEVREMNIMDFVEAGGTVESALEYLSSSRKDSTDYSGATVQANFTAKKASAVKGRGLRKNRATAESKTRMAPPSSALTLKSTRSRLQTPMSQRLPAVWDTPMVTPKFDVNLPFTPGLARAPKHGERLMSMAGSPVDVSTRGKVTTAMKQKTMCIAEEEEEEEEGDDPVDESARRLAAAYEVPQEVIQAHIHDFLSNFQQAKKQCDA